jgi:hypothetical protein
MQYAAGLESRIKTDFQTPQKKSKHNVMSLLHILCLNMKSGTSPEYVRLPFPAEVDTIAQKESTCYASNSRVYY